MIYNKDAAFPYPVLSNTNDSYENSNFEFEVESITETADAYELSFNYKIGSDFVQKLVQSKQAVIIFIIQSKDNLFFELDRGQDSLMIPKSRIAFNEKVRAQLHIQSRREISLSACEELNSFYMEIRDQLTIPSQSLIGYSNVSTVRNTGKAGVAIFERKIDPDMTLDFEIVLTSESIILQFKDQKHLLQTSRDKNLMNIYLYTGLEKALQKFMREHLESDEEVLYLDELDDSNLNDLDFKLYQLLKIKGIDEMKYEETDEYIQKIAPGIIRKFTHSVERLNESES